MATFLNDAELGGRFYLPYFEDYASEPPPSPEEGGPDSTWTDKVEEIPTMFNPLLTESSTFNKDYCKGGSSHFDHKEFCRNHHPASHYCLVGKLTDTARKCACYGYILPFDCSKSPVLLEPLKYSKPQWPVPKISTPTPAPSPSPSPNPTGDLQWNSSPEAWHFFVAQEDEPEIMDQYTEALLLPTERGFVTKLPKYTAPASVKILSQMEGTCTPTNSSDSAFSDVLDFFLKTLVSTTKNTSPILGMIQGMGLGNMFRLSCNSSAIGTIIPALTPTECTEISSLSDADYIGMEQFSAVVKEFRQLTSPLGLLLTNPRPIVALARTLFDYLERNLVAGQIGQRLRTIPMVGATLTNALQETVSNFLKPMLSIIEDILSRTTANNLAELMDQGLTALFTEVLTFIDLSAPIEHMLLDASGLCEVNDPKKAETILWEIPLEWQQTFDAGVAFSLDANTLPLLLNLNASSGVFGWGVKVRLGFGLNAKKGVFIFFGDPKEDERRFLNAEVYYKASSPDGIAAYMHGRLGFFEVHGEDRKKMTSLSFGLSMDVLSADSDYRLFLSKTSKMGYRISATVKAAVGGFVNVTISNDDGPVEGVPQFQGDISASISQSLTYVKLPGKGGTAPLPLVVNISLNELGMKVGDFAEKVLRKVTSSIADPVAKLGVMVTAIGTEIPGLSDLSKDIGGPPVTSATIIDVLVALGSMAAGAYDPNLPKISDLVRTYMEIDAFLQAIEKMVDEGGQLSFGDFRISRTSSGKIELCGCGFFAEVLDKCSNCPTYSASMPTSFPGFPSWVHVPLITNPMNLLRLIQKDSRGADIVFADIPPITAAISMNIQFRYYVAVVNIRVAASFTLDICIGVNSAGIQNAISTGRALDSLASFFVSTTEFCNGTGEYKPIVIFTFAVLPSVSFDAFLASIEVGGGLQAAVDIFFMDPGAATNTQDGRMDLSELLRYLLEIRNPLTFQFRFNVIMFAGVKIGGVCALCGSWSVQIGPPLIIPGQDLLALPARVDDGVLTQTMGDDLENLILSHQSITDAGEEVRVLHFKGAGNIADPDSFTSSQVGNTVRLVEQVRLLGNDRDNAMRLGGLQSDTFVDCRGGHDQLYVDMATFSTTALMATVSDSRGSLLFQTNSEPPLHLQVLPTCNTVILVGPAADGGNTFTVCAVPEGVTLRLSSAGIDTITLCPTDQLGACDCGGRGDLSGIAGTLLLDHEDNSKPTRVNLFLNGIALDGTIQTSASDSDFLEMTGMGMTTGKVLMKGVEILNMDLGDVLPTPGSDELEARKGHTFSIANLPPQLNMSLILSSVDDTVNVGADPALGMEAIMGRLTVHGGVGEDSIIFDDRTFLSERTVAVTPVSTTFVQTVSEGAMVALRDVPFETKEIAVLHYSFARATILLGPASSQVNVRGSTSLSTSLDLNRGSVGPNHVDIYTASGEVRIEGSDQSDTVQVHDTATSSGGTVLAGPLRLSLFNGDDELLITLTNGTNQQIFADMGAGTDSIMLSASATIGESINFLGYAVDTFDTYEVQFFTKVYAEQQMERFFEPQKSAKFLHTSVNYINAETLTISGSSKGDRGDIAATALATALLLDMREGDDLVQFGSSGPQSVLTGMEGRVFVKAGEGADRVCIDDSGNTMSGKDGNIYRGSDVWPTELGDIQDVYSAVGLAPVPLPYRSVETVDIYLGSLADRLQVKQSHSPGMLNIFTGDGEDEVLLSDDTRSTDDIYSIHVDMQDGLSVNCATVIEEGGIYGFREACGDRILIDDSSRDTPSYLRMEHHLLRGLADSESLDSLGHLRVSHTNATRVSVYLGSGDDDVEIFGIHSELTSIDGGAGNDIFVLHATQTASKLWLRGGSGDEALHVDPLYHPTLGQRLAVKDLSFPLFAGHVMYDGESGSDDIDLVYSSTGTLSDPFGEGVFSFLRSVDTIPEDIARLSVRLGELDSDMVFRTGQATTWPTGRAHSSQRINFGDFIATMVVQDMGGVNQFCLDDLRVPTTIMTERASTFIVGQLYNTSRDEAAKLDPRSRAPTIRTTQGYLSVGTRAPLTLLGGEGDDVFVLQSYLSDLRAFGRGGNDVFILRSFVSFPERAPIEAGNLQILGEEGDDSIQMVGEMFVSGAQPLAVTRSHSVVDGGPGRDVLAVALSPQSDTLLVTDTALLGAGIALQYRNFANISIYGGFGDDSVYVLSSPVNTSVNVFGGLGSDQLALAPRTTPPVTAWDFLGHSGIIELSVVVDSDATASSWQHVISEGVTARIYDRQDNHIIISSEKEWLTLREDVLEQKSYTVLLSSPPARGDLDVCVQPILPDIPALSVSPSFVCFDKKTWNVPQAITLSTAGVADGITYPQAFAAIQHRVTTDPPNVEPWNTVQARGLTLQWVDVDSPSIVSLLEQSTTILVEGSEVTASFHVVVTKCDQLVDRTVEVSMTESVQNQLNVRALTKTGQYSDWQSANSDPTLVFDANFCETTVQVRARADQVVEGNSYVSLMLNVQDALGSFLSPSLTVPPQAARFRIVDSDAPAVVVETTSSSGYIQVAEGQELANSNSYTVRLSQAPDSTVDIVSRSIPTVTEHTMNNPIQQVTLNGESQVTLRFTSENWEIPQIVTVEAAFAPGASCMSAIQGDVQFFGGAGGYAEPPMPCYLIGETDGEFIAPLNGWQHVLEEEQVNTLAIYDLGSWRDGQDIDVEAGEINWRESTPSVVYYAEAQVVQLLLSPTPEHVHVHSSAAGTRLWVDTAHGSDSVQVTHTDAHLYLRLGQEDGLLQGEASDRDIVNIGNDAGTMEGIHALVTVVGDAGESSLYLNNSNAMSDDLVMMDRSRIVINGTTTNPNPSTLFTQTVYVNAPDGTFALMNGAGSLLLELPVGATAAQVQRALQDALFPPVPVLEIPSLHEGAGVYPGGCGPKLSLTVVLDALFQQESQELFLEALQTEYNIPGCRQPSDWDTCMLSVGKCSESVHVEHTYTPSLGDVYTISMQGQLLHHGHLYPGLMTLTVDSTEHISEYVGDDITDTMVRMEGVNYLHMASLNINLGSGNELVIVRGSSATTTIYGSAGNETYLVSSAASIDTVMEANNLKGWLDYIEGELIIDAGLGSHRLLLSDEATGPPHQYSVSGLKATWSSDALLPHSENLGPLAPVRYSSGGDFVGGITLWGSGVADSLTVLSTLGAGECAGLNAVCDLPGTSMRTTTSMNLLGGNDIVFANLDLETDGFYVAHLGEGDDFFDASSGSKDMIVFGGIGHDDIRTGSGFDIVLGDEGEVLWEDDEGRVLASFGYQGSGDISHSVATAATSVRSRQCQEGSGDILEMGSGVNIAIGGEGDDKLIAGNGDDVLAGDCASVHMYLLTSKYSRVQVVNAIESAVGGNDEIIGNDGNDLIMGGAGNDTVRAGDGEDAVLGDAGMFRMSAALDSSLLLEMMSTSPAVYGDDELDLGRGCDIAFGNFGNDRLDGGEGSDYLWGDMAHYSVEFPRQGPIVSVGAQETAYPCDDILLGRAGEDFLAGQQGHDEIHGGAGEDDIWGGHSTREGADGADKIYGDEGSDVILGDNGKITRLFQEGPHNIQLCGYTTWRPYFLKTFDRVPRTTIRLVDDISDAGGDDVVDGGAGDDRIWGQDGHDTLLGNDGDDEVIGGAGHDELWGGEGGDTLLGDHGLIYRATVPGHHAPLMSTVTGAQKRGVVLLEVGSLEDAVATGRPSADGARDMLMSADLLLWTGAYERDGLTKYSENNVWDTRVYLVNLTAAGDDTLHGGPGNDMLFGQRGNDILHGDQGDDLLFGDESVITPATHSEFPIIHPALELRSSRVEDVPLRQDRLLVDWSTHYPIAPGRAPLFRSRSFYASETASQASRSGLGRVIGAEVLQALDLIPYQRGLWRDSGVRDVPLVRMVADHTASSRALPGRDVLSGGPGDDLLFGDRLHMDAPLSFSAFGSHFSQGLRSTFSTWNNAAYRLHGMARDWNNLRNATSETPPPSTHVLFADHLDGDSGRDMLFGDEGRVMCGLHGLHSKALFGKNCVELVPLSTSYLNFVMDLGVLALNADVTIHQSHVWLLRKFQGVAQDGSQYLGPVVQVHAFNDQLTSTGASSMMFGDYAGILVTSLSETDLTSRRQFECPAKPLGALRGVLEKRMRELDQHIETNLRDSLAETPNLSTALLDIDHQFSVYNDILQGGSESDLLAGDTAILAFTSVPAASSSKNAAEYIGRVLYSQAVSFFNFPVELAGPSESAEYGSSSRGSMRVPFFQQRGAAREISAPYTQHGDVQKAGESSQGNAYVTARTMGSSVWSRKENTLVQWEQKANDHLSGGNQCTQLYGQGNCFAGWDRDNITGTSSDVAVISSNGHSIVPSGIDVQAASNSKRWTEASARLASQAATVGWLGTLLRETTSILDDASFTLQLHPRIGGFLPQSVSLDIYLSVEGCTALEGELCVALVRLSRPSTHVVAVSLRTTDSVSASGIPEEGDREVAQENVDYMPLHSLTLYLAPGETSLSLPISTIHDSIQEVDEVFGIEIVECTVNVQSGFAMGHIVDEVPTVFSASARAFAPLSLIAIAVIIIIISTFMNVYDSSIPFTS